MNKEIEVREWATQDFMGRVAQRLMTDRVAFSYTPKRGIVFTAPDDYVWGLIYKLMVCDGVRRRPAINEITK